MTDQRMCRDCGFLAMRTFETRQLVEADEDVRVFGRVPPNPTNKSYIFLEVAPLCFAQAWNLREQFNSIGEADLISTEDIPAPPEGWSGNAQRFITLISKERDCSAFIRWVQGFTPKEHLEMKERHQLQEWQADLQKQLVQSQNATQIRTAVIAAVFLILGVALTAALGQWLK